MDSMTSLGMFAPLVAPVRSHWRAIIVTVATVVAVLVVVLLLMAGRHSETYRSVERDQTWLGYLPPAGADVVVGGLNVDKGAGTPVRRVDLVERHAGQVVSLCFASSAESLRRGCPGFKLLGRTGRDVDLPVVGQLGTDTVDWLARLRSQVPALQDLGYLDQ